jgi:Protein of unknown function (DUF3632)
VNDQDSSPTWKLDLDKWVNFSSFLARCIEAGLNDHHKYPCEHFELDISEFLEHDFPPGTYRDCWVMIAAQYILLAGRTIRKHIAGGLQKWQQLANRFKEIADEGDKESESNLAINGAYEKMASLGL